MWSKVDNRDDRTGEAGALDERVVAADGAHKTPEAWSESRAVRSQPPPQDPSGTDEESTKRARQRAAEPHNEPRKTMHTRCNAAPKGRRGKAVCPGTMWR